MAFKGGPVYPDRAGASQPETNENHRKHKKPYKSCIQGWPTGMAYIHTYIHRIAQGEEEAWRAR